MVLLGTKQTSSGVYECTPDSGSAFFLRTAYLSLVQEESLFLQEGQSVSFTQEESLDIMTAALMYSAECAAMTYLARAEHCRASLAAKLLRKGLDRHAVNGALDYLESIRYLDDERFAGAWLRSRSIDHAEGRIRLNAELLSRGVDRKAAQYALDEFFASHDEQELCERAYRKIARFKQDTLKIQASLVRSGFTLKEIKAASMSFGK